MFSLVGLAIWLTSGCVAAPQSNVYADFRQRCIAAWGPENTWTPRQEAIFQDTSARLLSAQSASVATSVYRPPLQIQFAATAAIRDAAALATLPLNAGRAGWLPGHA